MNILKVTPNELFSFESFADINDLINEMTLSMKNNEKLTRMMYKFYISIKFQ